MSNQAEVQGNQNIVIQEVSESSITINVDGESKEIRKELSELKELLKDYQSQMFEAAGKAFNIATVTEGNFDFVVDQSRTDKSLPEELRQDLITDRNRWIQSLKQELQKQRVAVPNNPSEIINYYGWLIEVFLQKMLTPPGQAGDLRSLSFMTEAWFSSIRYLTLIRLAELIKHEDTSQAGLLNAYFQLNGNPFDGQLAEESNYDYLNLLTSLAEVDAEPFVAEIGRFLDLLLDTESDLYATSLFLETQRNRLIRQEIKEAELPELIPQYLTGLTYWLRKLAFLAKYRLVSIKDINLSYRLGSTKSFVHLYGELHGMYDQAFSDSESGDYNTIIVDQYFTYNHSVLLFKGTHISSCLENIQDDSSYISLSPLLIDQSVFANKNTQTPEVFYYIGQSKRGRRFHFAQYKNELPLQGQTSLTSNKSLTVSVENTKQPKLNDLYEQMDAVLKPFKSAAS